MAERASAYMGAAHEQKQYLACALRGSKGPWRPQNNSFFYRAGGQKVLFEAREHKPVVVVGSFDCGGVGSQLGSKREPESAEYCQSPCEDKP